MPRQAPSEAANKVSMSDFIFLETIGMGSYGRVRLCRNKKTNKVFAIKMLKKSEIIRMKQVDHVYSEYTILSSIYHPFIVELKGVNFTDPSYIYFLLEYISGGEMFTLLRDSNCFPIEFSSYFHLCALRTCPSDNGSDSQAPFCRPPWKAATLLPS